jgi:anti-sigma regulatory factor (Ser/Thr protein kinase)
MTDATPAFTAAGFVHMLYPYAGEQQYLSGTLAYIQHAREAGGTVVVAAPAERRSVLGAHLGAGDGVTFVDTAALGRNPGRLIPAWRDWIARAARAGAVHGINESAWSAHGGAREGELRYQEWLLNLAFARAPAWSLMCPVDTTGLRTETVEALARCHPLVWNGAARVPADGYTLDAYTFEELPEPAEPYEQLTYTVDDLHALREKTSRWALAHRLPLARAREFTLAVSEVATNSIRYGGGSGTLRLWAQDAALVCELHDAGVITDPLAGRVRPARTELGGRGLWFVNQLCDLVEIRSAPGRGTRVRLWIELPADSTVADGRADDLS